MGKIVLTYFNARGRAELCRYILAYAGVDYEDRRIEKENWPEIKPTILGGQLPVLEVDGKMLPQSLAMARYLAREYGLAGKNNWDQAKADMIVDFVSDIGVSYIRSVYHEQDETKKAEARKKFVEDVLPQFFENLIKFLGSDEYFVGNEVTWADFAVFGLCSVVKKEHEEAFKDYPGLIEHCKRIGNIPNIKKWVESRPVTPF